VATAPVMPEMGEEDAEQMQAPTPFESLSDEAKAGLQELLRQALKEDPTGRRNHVRDAWKLRLYCKGRQQIWYDDKSFMYMGLEASGQQLPKHRAVFDITSPHKRSFVSILSENPTGINFVPDDLQKSVDVTSAKLAEKMRSRVDRAVQMKERQSKAAGYLCTDGLVLSWTRLDDKGKLNVTMHGVLEAKVPLYTEDKADWDYCIISRERNLWKAKASVDEATAKKITAGTDSATESQFERYARLNIVSGKIGSSAESLKSLVTEHYGWIDPCRYQKLSAEVEEELEKLYPEGVCIHAYGDVVVGATAENMDCLAVEHPVDGEGQVRPALLSGVPDIQDAYNDIKNQLLELVEFGAPAGWFNSNAVDPEAVSEQRAEPGVWHPMALASGQDIRSQVMQEDPVQISQQVVMQLDALKQDAEFTTGDFPSLYGGDTPGQDTVGVNKLLNNQAKGQLGPAWAALQRLFSKIYPVAIILMVKTSGDGDIAVGGMNGAESFNPATILDGNFGCNPDQDSSFPETTADKRSSLQAVLGQLGQGAAGEAIVYAPDNLKLIKQLSGLKDLMIPGAEARDKQLWEIERMLNEPPIPDQSQMQEWEQDAQQAEQQGQQPPPFPMTSSIPIGKRDYHQAELDKVQEWLSSTACREEQQKGNVQGIQNVNLHADAHEAAIQAAAPAPQFKPPNISVTAKVDDPSTISKILAMDGVQSNPQDIAASQVPAQQQQAADTQHKAAQAQHQAVLAAKEFVAPVKSIPSPTAPSKIAVRE
jgi:hypothetical protein